MPYASRADRLAHSKRYKKQHADRLRPIENARKRAKKVEIKAYIAQIRAESACIQCGEDTDCCLDFHHRDPSDKKFEVAAAPNKGVSIQTLQEEIAKCDILCANCHRKVHAGVAQ